MIAGQAAPERNNIAIRPLDCVVVALLVVCIAVSIAALAVGTAALMKSSDNTELRKNSANGACQPAPCKNNGTCVDVAENYICSCIATYYGRDCEFGKAISKS